MAATPTFGSSTNGLVGIPEALGRGGAGAERPVPLVEYDRQLKRVWVAGQRLHHGATGTALAWAGATELLSGRGRKGAALLVAGSVLMAHDWKDRSIWFERGRQNQPPPEPRAGGERPRSFRLQRRLRRG